MAENAKSWTVPRAFFHNTRWEWGQNYNRQVLCTSELCLELTVFNPGLHSSPFILGAEGPGGDLTLGSSPRLLRAAFLREPRSLCVSWYHEQSSVLSATRLKPTSSGLRPHSCYSGITMLAWTGGGVTHAFLFWGSPLGSPS